MKTKLLIIILIIVFLGACTNDNLIIDGNTKEEPLNPRINSELSEEEAKQLFLTYVNILPGNKKTKTSRGIKIKDVSKDYHLSNSVNLLKSTVINNNIDSVALYNFSISDGINEGFALVLGDVRFPHVLCFSENGSLNDTVFNEGLKEWTRSIPEYIEKRKEAHYHAMDSLCKTLLSKKVKSQDSNITGRYDVVRPGDSVFLASRYVDGCLWPYYHMIWHNCYIGSTNIEGIGDDGYYYEHFLQTMWGQDEPFNNNSPNLYCDGKVQKAYAGCWPVAIAQLMAEKEYPNSYNWSLLKQSATISSSETARANEVARLIRDLQVQLSPDYDCHGTSVNRDKALKFLSKYFYYDRNYYPQNQNSYPFLIMGRTPSGKGHAYIIDGAARFRIFLSTSIGITLVDLQTKTEEFWPGGGSMIYNLFECEQAYHINWGWAGSSDGWYSRSDGYRYTQETDWYSNFRRK